MSRYYLLENKLPKPCEMMDWAKCVQDPKEKIVGLTKIGDIKISTVFLGLDHCWDDGPPLLFETMIFGGDHDEYQERCTTWEEAETMHRIAVDLVKIK